MSEIETKGSSPLLEQRPDHVPAPPPAPPRPCETVYVNNLNEKINRQDLVNGLREVFEQFGMVLDIVCYTKIRKCKGQAWIVFEELEPAKVAIDEMNGFMFFGKPMRVAFAKSQSDASRRRRGEPVPVRVRPPKRKRRPQQSASPSSDEPKEDVAMADATTDDSAVTALPKTGTEPSTDGPKEKRRRVARRRDAPPNKILFIENVPHECSTEEISQLFGRFAGFVKVTLIESKPGIGFVEYLDLFHAKPVVEQLHGYDLKGNLICVSYAAQ